MRIRNVVLSSALLALTLLPAQSAFGVSKEIVQLQTQVQHLQDQMTQMKQSFDERMGVMRNLLEQSTDNMNRVTQQMDTLTRTLQQQQQDAGSRTDQVSGQIQSLHDSVDELKARVAALSKKLDDMAQQGQNMNSTAAASVPKRSVTAPRTRRSRRSTRRLPPTCSTTTLCATTTPQSMTSPAGVWRLHEVLCRQRSRWQRAVLYCRH